MAPKVLLIDENSKSLGLVSLDQALYLAYEAGLDLVQVSPSPQAGEPPVTKIIDYGKWKYHHEKLLKKQRQASKTVVNEVWLTPVIDTNDFNHKVSQINGYLNDGDEVIVVMKFKGIHKRMYKEGGEIMDKLVEDRKDHGVVQSRKKDGNNMIIRFTKLGVKHE